MVNQIKRVMKELSIEEKAKAYDEAIERAKKYYKECKMRGNDWFVEDIEDMFPELKESEDERIRKELKEFLGICLNARPQIIEEPQYLKFTNWLEKQCEQKQELLTKEKALKNSPFVEQKPVWSEDDEKMIRALLSMCDVYSTKFSFYPKENKDIERLKSWLKHLKERYTWKPSDEQIKAIRLARSFVTDDFDEHPALSEILIELEKQLKKLRDE